MTARIRVLVLLARPSLVLLVGMFAATGLAQAGHGNDGRLLAEVLSAVVGCLVFAVAVNDLGDEYIDGVNLSEDARRPLVTGAATRIDMVALAVVSAVVAVATSVMISWPAFLVTVFGVGFTACYSLRPVRIADRGVIAPMLLPLGYVAVPYLLGIFAVRTHVTRTDMLLLSGLYAGFVGRILLKDFRDVRGDALFGKRTFLVRHGRRATCTLSAVFLTAGVSVLPNVRNVSLALALEYGVMLATTLVLLQRLAMSTSARRDTSLIAAIALLGRGMVVLLYGQLVAVAPVVAGIWTVVVLLGVRELVRTGAMSDWSVREQSLDTAAVTS